MTQLARTLVDTSFPLARQTGDRIGRIFHILNANQTLTEDTLFSGKFTVRNKAGIPVPDNDPGAADGGAGNLDGDYSWAVTFYDEDRDVEGNASDTVALNSLSSRQVDLDLTTILNEYDNSRVTHFRIYRTLGTGSTAIFFFVAQVAIETTSYTDNNSDATIQANDTLLTNNDAPADETYGVAKAHKSFMFNVGPFNPLGGTDYDDDFSFSKLANGDAHPLLNRTKIEPGRYGKLVTAEDSGDALIFYKERAIYELHFDEDPSGVFGDGFGKTMNTRRGTLNPRTVVNYQGTHFVMDQGGIYANAGGTSQMTLSKPLKAYWDRINWDAKLWFHGAADDDAVYFFVALDDDTLPRHVFVLDLTAVQAGQPTVWTLYEYDFSVVDSQPHRFGDTGKAAAWGLPHARVIAVMTDAGYTGYLRAGYRDLASPALTASGTVTGSSGATNFSDSGATFRGANENGDVVDLNGCYVFFRLKDTDQADTRGWTKPYLVSATTSTACTLAEAAPSAIPTGTEYVIGRIPNARIYTPVMGGENPWRVKRAARTAVMFQPLGVATTMKLKMSLDRKAPEMTDFTYESGQIDATRYGEGVPIKIGGSLQDGGRKGVHATPAPGNGYRNLQLIFEAADIDCPGVIGGIYVDDVIEEISEGE